jgi:hypothetical protein
VNFVEDHRVDIVEVPGSLQQHVAQHFSGHDHDARVAIFGDITSKQTDLIAVDRPQVAILLVGEGLYGCGVDHPAGAPEGFPDAEFGHHGLASARWSGDHDRVAFQQGGNRLALEVIELEWIERLELGNLRCEAIVSYRSNRAAEGWLFSASLGGWGFSQGGQDGAPGVGSDSQT